MATDPVCGMEVDETIAKDRSEYQGQVYYFCSARCKRDFEQNPQAYAMRQSAADMQNKE